MSNKDFLTRLTQLAGDDVTAQIVTEFGGQPVYIRADRHQAGRVYCRDCEHITIRSNSRPRCSVTNYYTSPLHPRVCSHFLPNNRDTASMSNAAEKPMAMSAPQSTETKTEAGVTGQVAAQSNPDAPVAHTKKDREFLRTIVIQVAMVLLMVVLSLTSTQTWIQEYSATAIAVTILIVSIQLLIGASLFL